MSSVFRLFFALFFGAISSIGLLFFLGGGCGLALVHKYLHIRILGPGTSKLSCTHGLYDQVDKSLGPTEADESKPRTGLLGAQVYDGLV